MAAKLNVNALAQDQQNFGIKPTGVACFIAFVILLLTATIAQAQPARDSISDRVGATAGQFRVDESGSATYSIPIYTPPGTAGVVPQLGFSYSSQGGNGPLGKGWGVSGTSGISRCRATREHGDFFANGAAIDGDPAPINFSSTDRFCLDGQRLIPAPATAQVCRVLAGATVTQYRTELESFQRICEYRFILADGPRFFTVERKDGSTSWYGDRVSTAGSASGTRADSVIPVTATPSVFLGWAQTRFQDSTGNYIDYDYLNNPAGVTYTGEQLLYQVRYTGKVVLPGQSSVAKPTYATVRFNYSTLPIADIVSGYTSGMLMYQTQKLDSVSVFNGSTTVRHYVLNYAKSISGTNANTLTSFKECSDATQTTCYSPTSFEWSVARNQFGTGEDLGAYSWGSLERFEGFKMGDIDGDGRQDIVRLYDGKPTVRVGSITIPGDACQTELVVVGFSTMDNLGRPVFTETGTQASATGSVCTPMELAGETYYIGDDGWQLFDYNGDGRDDLFMANTAGDYVLYLSQGRTAAGVPVFNKSVNVIAGMILGANNGKDNTPVFVDINGDGLLDVIYAGNGGTQKIRLNTRIGSSYAFGAERAVTIDTSEFTTECDPNLLVVCAFDIRKQDGAFKLQDFNGDGASDLIGTIRKDTTYYNNQGHEESTGTTEGYLLTVKQVTTAVVELKAKNNNRFVMAIHQKQVEPSPYPVEYEVITDPVYRETTTTYIDVIDPVDINGDGLTDLLLRKKDTDNIAYLINKGGSFAASAMVTVGWGKYLQIVDVNGDGRTDVLYPNKAANDIYRYNVRYGQANGSFSNPLVLPGGGLIECADFCMDRFSYIFNDFDADGGLDFLKIKWQTASGDSSYRFYIYRPDAVSRFQPRDVIMRITNGFGAKTELAYQPLTLKSIYLRDTNSRNSLNWGRGSPVQDLLAPMYVVAMARSSAPTYNNAAAMSTLYYRYAGAKIQAGGRGYLGFREITTFDVNYGGKYIASTTQYAQNFPFIGSPITTSRRVISGTYTPDACYTVVTDSCYTSPGTAFPALGGIQVAASVQSWEVSPAFNPGLQEVLHTRTQGTQDEQFDLGTGVRTSRVNTAMSYTAFGNVSLTAVDTYTGTSNANPVSISTNNTYVNDEANWRLGRMTASTVTHTRDGASITRNTAYDYDMAGPVTGFLKAERIQPGGSVREDLRTEYQLDQYGNRIGSYTCSANVAPCQQTTGLALNVWYSYEQVQRYSRVTFDADGRYPVTTHEPFRALGSTWDSGQITEHVTQTVLARDEFGEPTQVQDVNGRVAASMNGAMGRDYWSWAPTTSTQAVGAIGAGIHSYKTYRFCGIGSDQVTCPTSAVFREEVKATGAPTKWAYFDLLGRPMLAVAQSFNTNTPSKDHVASCTLYDATGKTYASSNPFFRTGLNHADGSPDYSPGTPCTLTGSTQVNWNYSLYDVLGRPTQVILADGSSTSIAYNGLSSTTTNAKGQTKTELKNASGELVQATDQQGFGTYYYYNAAGNLTSVQRNAGRGVIGTYMSYDTLGRKISMSDPDAGVRYYGYTPAGELEVETDGTGKHLWKRYDRRGRVVWEGNVDYTPEPDLWEKQTVIHFDQAVNGIGQVHSSASSGTSRGWVGIAGRETNQSMANVYDDMGRVYYSTTQIDGVNYNSAVVYDGLGRGYKTQDPSGKWTKTEFTPRGFAVRVCSTDENDGAPGCLPGHPNTYSDILEKNARGQVLTDRKGGSVDMVTVRHYDDLTGRNTRICVGSAGCQVVNETYAWDTVGNLTYQDKGGYREDFVYDGMSRLTEGRLTRVGATTYAGNVAPISVYNTYDLLGNVCSKMIDNVLQNYSYTGRAGCGLNGSLGNVNADLINSPHQAQSANGYTYAYDSHGNQTVASHGTASKSRSVIYTLDERAYEMTKGNDVTRFWYGVGGDRYKRVDISATGTKTTINVANLEIETLNGITTTKRTVAGVLLEETKNNVVTNKYLHHDQLGNVVRITDANGVVLEKLDFAAFGERRNAIDPRQTFIVAGQVSNGTVTLPGNQILTLYATKRGFTGHEMVDGFDIVHMNGRIYDNMIGRFLQADPIVQDPSNTQNFNRYTYVWNNPLAFTDPSGYSSVSNMFRQILAIAIVIVGNILIPGSATLWQSMLLGFLSGTVTGGLKGGITGAFSAGLFFGIGTGFAKLAAAGKYAAGTLTAMKVLVHGIAGGVMSVMQGGKFGHGFASAGVTQAFANSIDSLDAGNAGFSAARTVAASIVGGTASVLSGGKFASGAITGAFSRAFNEEIAEHKKSRIIEEGQEIINRLVGEAKADPNANLNLNKREIGILSAFSAYEVKAHSNSVLGYSWLHDKIFEMYTWSRGDSIFAAFHSRKFNITGFGENFDGVYGGNDMNYMKFGMMYAEANKPAIQMRKVISSYNIDQNDAAQIPRATPWGNFGYKFYNEFFGAKK